MNTLIMTNSNCLQRHPVRADLREKGKQLSFRLKKGLDLPLPGKPMDTVEETRSCKSVAILGDDYIGLKPEILVSVDEQVKIGQLVMADKKNPEARFTAPAGGRVLAVNRGEKRRLLSIEIAVENDEAIQFPVYEEKKLSGLSAEQIRDALIASGLWVTIRTRPFNRTPKNGEWPASVFVSAMDTQPLAAPVEKFINANSQAFHCGLLAVSRLLNGFVYLCRRPGPPLPGEELEKVRVATFQGPHPAGLPGTHIHFIDPVRQGKTVWHINYQDVAAIGSFFLSGRLPLERCISLAGPMVRRPRLLKTRIGASLADLTVDELNGENNRLISGSVLAGRHALAAECFLGRFHQQVTVLPDTGPRQLLGWARPGRKTFSLTRAFLGAFWPPREFQFIPFLHGGKRAIVPIGGYEKVMPLDLLPTFLLKALIIGDLEQAEALGALELAEEDLALCTFVCPGKHDYAPLLRQVLTSIEKEG